MGIENITEKILNEANTVAEDSIKKAENQSLEIINNAKQKADEIITDALKKAKSNAEALKSRKISAAELEERKMLLSAKQEAVKKSFNLALQKLVNMPDDKYIDFLAKEILVIPNCEGEIFLNKKDKERIGEKLVNIVNEKLKGNKVFISDSTIQVSGGFILKSGNIQVNSTFETILSSKKEELTFEVAKVLFE